MVHTIFQTRNSYYLWSRLSTDHTNVLVLGEIFNFKKLKLKMIP
jgi:hypothetical protein